MFSSHGLSQHFSKSPDPCCHSESVTPQFPSATIPHAAFSLGAAEPSEDLIGSPEPMAPMDVIDADAFDNLNLGGDNLSEIVQSDGDDGEFNGTCVTA